MLKYLDGSYDPITENLEYKKTVKIIMVNSFVVKAKENRNSVYGHRLCYFMPSTVDCSIATASANIAIDTHKKNKMHSQTCMKVLSRLTVLEALQHNAQEEKRWSNDRSLRTKKG